MKQKVSVDVRVDPSMKARWQAAADAEGVTVGELVRRRMQIDAPRVQAPVAVDLAAEELQSLRGWFGLRDCDGHLDPALLAEWQGYADTHGITLGDLLGRVAVDANAALV